MFQVRLKELRENIGYSQYAFANAFGVAQSTVGNWEAGKREPNFDTAQRLADFFKVSVDYLLGRTDDPAPPSTSETLATEEQAIKLLGITDEANIKTLKELIELMKKTENNAEIANELLEKGYNGKRKA